MWRPRTATPIGAPADGLCAGCSRAILRGDTVRVNAELRVVHWDCGHRDMQWRARVFDDLVNFQAARPDRGGVPKGR